MNHGMLPIRIEKPSHNLPFANCRQRSTTCCGQQNAKVMINQKSNVRSSSLIKALLFFQLRGTVVLLSTDSAEGKTNQLMNRLSFSSMSKPLSKFSVNFQKCEVCKISFAMRAILINRVYYAHTLLLIASPTQLMIATHLKQKKCALPRVCWVLRKMH